jgi:hypothetical protein
VAGVVLLHYAQTSYCVLYSLTFGTVQGGHLLELFEALDNFCTGIR